MKKVTRYIYKLFDKLFPPLKFNLNSKRKKKEVVTEEDMDKWATEYLEKLERERRNKRGTRN